jgi:CRISPR/Cas system CSM-associated protein Csm3 (group 7 of RAMP superfamily)
MIGMTLGFEFKTPYIVKSGFGYAGIYDDTIIRNGKGFFYIPGSTIKGRIRAYTLKMLRSYKEYVCPEDNVCKDRSNACIICRLFGSPFMECPLAYTDAKLESKQKKLFGILNDGAADSHLNSDTIGVTNISINRKRRIALDKGLFITELPPEGIKFSSRICGECKENDLEILLKGIKLITHFGANKSRGIGRLTDEGIVVEVKYDIKP